MRGIGQLKRNQILSTRSRDLHLRQLRKGMHTHGSHLLIYSLIQLLISPGCQCCYITLFLINYKYLASFH
ncbi:hypothetical protein BD408DRAFT_420160 [Parasitella parasitica]|nr:hypothetical protein BD408DRAFT_420160 [Parasitella parasitica]